MTIQNRSGWAAVVAIFMAFNVDALAEDEALVVAPDELVFCTVCHGVQLMGNRQLESPRLSQMEGWYVEQQMLAYRNGWRGTHPEDLVGMEMRPMAQVLTDEQIELAAEFVNSTRSPPPVATIDGDVSAGKKHYASCAICHGVNAEGDEALGAPALTGLNDWYLLRQLRNYKSGVRGSDPADSYGMQMRASTALLEDDQAILDVVAYMNTLPTQ